jgi:hypothetical protein
LLWHGYSDTLSRQGATIIEATHLTPGKDFDSIGPVLPSEMANPPYRPKVAGRIAFFFGPVAGAIVTVINLRRFGYPLKANRVFLWTLLATVLLAMALLLIPDALGRVIGFALEVASYKVYAALQQNEFDVWQAAHPDTQPRNGWNAVGLGFVGLALFVVMMIAVAVPLSMVFPSVF